MNGSGMIYLPPAHLSSLSSARRISGNQKTNTKGAGFRVGAAAQASMVAPVLMQGFVDTLPISEREAVQKGYHWLKELKEYYLSFLEGKEKSSPLELEDLELGHLPIELKRALREIQTRIAVERAKNQR